MTATASLVLRLTAPLQSWGTSSQFNRRDTGAVPSKSGILGLLAAAQGRRRTDPIADLVALRLAVRIDEPGWLLRDYHTVSDYRGYPLLSAATLASGLQKLTSPSKSTHVTNRYYLQDALFVAVVNGERGVLEGLAHALQHPAFPLALGRRACPPAHPLILPVAGERVVDAGATELLAGIPWQVSEWRRRSIPPARRRAMVRLDTIADTDGPGEIVTDVPLSFDPRARKFATRRVVRGSVEVPSGFSAAAISPTSPSHDPFALLG